MFGTEVVVRGFALRQIDFTNLQASVSLSLVVKITLKTWTVPKTIVMRLECLLSSLPPAKK